MIIYNAEGLSGWIAPFLLLKSNRFLQTKTVYICRMMAESNVKDGNGNTLNDGDSVTLNPAFYIIAHASKFVRPGSTRIGSSVVEGLPNVAFQTPTKELVLIVINDTKASKTFNIAINGKMATTVLNAGAVGTYTW